jgi:hypothetical protein
MPEATQTGAVAPKALLNISGVGLDQLYQAICAKKGTAEAVPLYTLANLGFTRSDEAAVKGYFCVRPHYSRGMRSFPGLWVAPGHQQIVGDLAETLRHTSSSSHRGALVAAREREFEQLLAEHQLDLDAYDRAVLYQELVKDAWFAFGRTSREKIQKILNRAAAGKIIAMACAKAPDRIRPQYEGASAFRVQVPFTFNLHGKEHTLPLPVRLLPEGAEWKTLCKEAADGTLTPEQIVERLVRMATNLASSGRRKIETLLAAQEKAWQHLHADWYPSDEQVLRAIKSVLEVHWLPGSHIEQMISQQLNALVFDAIRSEVDRLGYKIEAYGFCDKVPMHVPGMPAETTVAMPIIVWFDDFAQSTSQAPKAHLRSVLDGQVKKRASEQEARLHQAFEKRVKGLLPADKAPVKDMPDPYLIQAKCVHDYMRKRSRAGSEADSLLCGDEFDYKICRKLDEEVRGRMEKYERQRLIALSAAQADYIQQFPIARKMQRKLVAYLGPTNSGKTWQALNRLAEAHTGAYLGPLRLLALEGQEELERRGCNVSLITGEERDLKEGATHIASTIEMADLQTPVDCVVIDEIQMLGDAERGAGWVQALVGMPAREIILTGSLNAQPALEQISQALGEPLEVHHLSRQTPLHILDAPTPLNRVEPGTAIIAFSRADVLRLQAQLPKGVTSAVIYGNLGPTVRRVESERFRSGEAKVLIATDAVAYGLNLPIKTVLFSTAHKYINRERIELDTALIQQIAGRAGRLGMHEAGFVGALDGGTLRHIQRGMASSPAAIRLPLQVRPGYANLLAIQQVVPEVNLVHRLLQFYGEYIKFDPALFRNQPLHSMLALARIADKYPTLALRDRFTLACAPVDRDNGSLISHFESYVRELAAGHVVTAKAPGSWMGHRTDDSETLWQAENLLKEYDLYAWLAFHFPDTFTAINDVQEWRAKVNRFICASLAKGVIRKCKTCHKPLPPHHVYPNCESCFRASRRRRYYDYDEDYLEDWY